MKKFIFSLLCGALLFGFADAKEFKVDNGHSAVDFKIKHLQISNVKGSFDRFEGDMDFDIDKKLLNSLEAKIFVDSINTRNESRDGHLKDSDYFDEKSYKEIKFVMSEFIPKDDGEGVLKGELTIKGISKPIELEYEFGGATKTRDGKDKIGFSLEGKVNRLDFGVGEETISLGSKVSIEIEIEAIEK